MKKKYALIWCIFIGLTVLSSSCKKKVAPISERIAKAWLAQEVKYNNDVVFTRGGSNNIVLGYSNFRLTLSTVNGENKVTYIEFDGNSFSGTWALDGDSKLTLSGLTPEPTGTGGTISFTIDSIDDNQMVITRTTTSKKTGDTKNTYTLVK
ncbi:hypothetical protein CLV98_109113 [Dyadobacter jejuensis]|uniref:Lipocalin-like protein n=1 Tax=Dyadobacter jejuensis TaxID=1082580 RepID=A0A316AJ49_9BACT|nr:hypothetical protein [Dyadobacter jejuensis]PWJ57004.1 hypothetical protein CLV98_109113 [Dyadobacter jejuensis]